MKIFTNRKLIQKVIISFVCVILLNFSITPQVQASWGGDLMGVIRDFTAAVADVAITVVQLGLTGEWNYAVAPKGSGSPENQDSYFIEEKKFEYPVIQISPELIFANKVEILNVDFIGGNPDSDYVIESGNSDGITKLRKIIASWYVTLRTMAVVGLLSVLIYIGIRIIISSTSQDRAKYKQRLMDWIVAFCLLFFMHYIMSATVNIVNRVNNILASDIESGLELNPDYGGVRWSDGFLGEGTDTDVSDMPGYDGAGGGSWSDVNASIQDDRNAIIKVKEELGINDSDITNESSSWKKIDNATFNGIKYSKAYSYTIECKDKSIIIYKLTTKKTYAEGGQEETKYSYHEITKDGTENNTGSSGSSSSTSTSNVDGLLRASESGKVLYFINYARMYLNVSENDEYTAESVGYLVIYIILIVFTGMFAVRYMKRVIYIAFLTLIAPMVALTYPIDKIKDRKSTSI